MLRLHHNLVFLLTGEVGSGTISCVVLPDRLGLGSGGLFVSGRCVLLFLISTFIVLIVVSLK